MRKKWRISESNQGLSSGRTVTSLLGVHVLTKLRKVSVNFSNHSKAVVPVLVLLFVALRFILRGDLLYVFPCIILFLCFSVLLVLRLPRLGKRELILVLFVRLFGLCLFRFVGFLFLLGSGKGCGLWLRHSLDFSLTFIFSLIDPSYKRSQLWFTTSCLSWSKFAFFYKAKLAFHMFFGSDIEKETL